MISLLSHPFGRVRVDDRYHAPVWDSDGSHIIKHCILGWPLKGKLSEPPCRTPRSNIPCVRDLAKSAIALDITNIDKSFVGYDNSERF